LIFLILQKISHFWIGTSRVPDLHPVLALRRIFGYCGMPFSVLLEAAALGRSFKSALTYTATGGDRGTSPVMKGRQLPNITPSSFCDVH
jgi:hypothetical protein